MTLSLARYPRREDVGVVTAGDGGEGVGVPDAGLLEGVPVEAHTRDAAAVELAAEAAECGLRSFQIMAGALEGDTITPELYSYEGTFGVGYAVASFTPQ